MPVFFLVGNTTLKMATPSGPVSVLALADAQDALPALLEGHRGQAGVAASVNPAAEPLLAAACIGAEIEAPVYAGRDFGTGVNVEIENPGAVGIDRILNVKAAYARSRSASAVVDLGTAISITVCDGRGALVGGAIMPGIALALRALHEGTAFLPEVRFEIPESCLGRNTVDAMISGVFFGTVGAVGEIVRRIEAETGLRLTVFLTGGNTAEIASASPSEWFAAPSLTLEGLRLAYEESR